jgi:hypothetical protein
MRKKGINGDHDGANTIKTEPKNKAEICKK